MKMCLMQTHNYLNLTVPIIIWRSSYEKVEKSAFKIIDGELPNAYTQIAVS